VDGLHRPSIGTPLTKRVVGKHGIPFAFAVSVFTDVRRIETEDLRPNRRGERRWNVVGIADGIPVNVTFAVDGEVTTIISARPAYRMERKRYGTP
jgi:uncharacterized DUF497 family protein